MCFVQSPDELTLVMFGQASDEGARCDNPKSHYLLLSKIPIIRNSY